MANPKQDQKLSGSRTALIVALALASLLLAADEFAWRRAGALPTFRNSEDRWSHVRSELAADSSPNAIALLGASRMQSDVDLDVLEEAFPNSKAYMLAWSGRTPYAAFKDLAEDERFKGIAIMSVVPITIVDGPKRDEQARNVVYWHERYGWSRRLERVFDDFFTSFSVTNDYPYGLQRIVAELLWSGTWPTEPDYVQTSARRETSLFFERADISRLRTDKVASIRRIVANAGEITPENWNESVESLQAMTQAIQARGGRVVFVRMPAGPVVLEIEYAEYPRSQYWDDLARRVDAEFIHFADEPTLRGFALPDESHLDASDRVAFTGALSAVLKSRGIER